MSSNLIELVGPTDAVSALVFSENNPVYLLASSWDGHLRLFDVSSRTLVRDFTECAPILDALFITETLVASASADGGLRIYDLEHGKLQCEKQIHKNAVRTLAYMPQHSMLVAGSWDRSLSLHNLAQGIQDTVYIQLPEKVFAISSNKEHVVVALSNRHVYIYSVAQLAESLNSHNGAIQPVQMRESSLKFMTRTIQCTLTSDPQMAGYVSTSVEGRVAVEFMNPEEASQSRKYAFKCHRQKSTNAAGEEEDVVHPVNAIEFHPKYGTFASAGGDGVVSVWDLKAKKRIKQYAAIGAEIQVLAYSPDSRFLAIGTGCLGRADHKQEGRIYLRLQAEGEGKGKS